MSRMGAVAVEPVDEDAVDTVRYPGSLPPISGVRDLSAEHPALWTTTLISASPRVTPRPKWLRVTEAVAIVVLVGLSLGMPPVQTVAYVLATLALVLLARAR